MTDDINPIQPDPDSDPMTLDAMLDALGDARARTVIRTLAERRPEYDSWDAMALPRAELIARHADESGAHTEGVTAGMHHMTLPKLEDLGFITYNVNAFTVEVADPTAITAAVRVMEKAEFELALAGGRA